jgi:hypothetical protein
MSALQIISEIVLAVVLSHLIVLCSQILTASSGWVWVIIPIIASFFLGLQVSRIIHTYKGE